MNTRLANVKKLLKEKKLDAVLVSSQPNIFYLTHFSHFSETEREAFLLITNMHNYILTDKRYTHAVQTHVKDFELLEFFYGHGFTDWMKRIAEEDQIRALGVEENNLTVDEYK